jgi:hypothetical protein
LEKFIAKILAVHGIGQQFSGVAIVHREWWSALISGLHLVGSDLKDEQELACAFYGHLFRKPSLAAVDPYRAQDVMARLMSSLMVQLGGSCLIC